MDLRCPPEVSCPDILVLFQVLETALECLNALLIGASSVLANETEFLILLEPVGGGDKALLENGRADAVCAGAGAVTVKVLVHLVDELATRGVVRVFEVDERGGISAGDPSPSTFVRLSAV